MKIDMFRKLQIISKAALAGLTVVGFIHTAGAQTFQHQVADLLLTLRKTGVYQENYEVVVNLGQASNYVNAAIGTTLPVTKFAASQLTPGCFASLNNLSWAVTGDYQGTTYAGYPTYTLWMTVPRTDNTVRSADALRLAFGDQSTVRGKIDSIFGGASYVSKDLGTSNQFNTLSLVRESISTYGPHDVSVWMASTVDNTIGTLNDTWPNTEPNSGNLEITTPSSFSGSVRSDLYEVRPVANAQGVAIVDPHTGTSGLAYYVGYFQLNSDGIMTFTKEPPQIYAFRHTSNTSTINFTTAGATNFTLYYTNNLAGLSTPVSSWPSRTVTLGASGNTNSLTDTTTDSVRFYRVGAH